MFSLAKKSLICLEKFSFCLLKTIIFLIVNIMINNVLVLLILNKFNQTKQLNFFPIKYCLIYIFI